MLWALIGSGRSSAGTLQSSGDWLLITWGWALAVCFAVYTVGGVTGAHINPAVTFGAAIRQQLPWNKVARYWIAQVLGCFVGAALVFLVYNNAINHFNHWSMRHGIEGLRADQEGLAGFRSHLQHVRHVPGAVLPQRVRAADRPDRGYVLPRHVRVGRDRRVRLAGRGEHDPMDRGHDRDGGRDLVRSQRWLRDQPGTRLRSAHLRLDRGLGETWRCPATTANTR